MVGLDFIQLQRCIFYVFYFLLEHFASSFLVFIETNITFFENNVKIFFHFSVYFEIKLWYIAFMEVNTWTFMKG